MRQCSIFSPAYQKEEEEEEEEYEEKEKEEEEEEEYEEEEKEEEEDRIDLPDSGTTSHEDKVVINQVAELQVLLHCSGNTVKAKHLNQIPIYLGHSTQL